ncbi:MAG: glycine--tRNA ligase subunit beta, partial [Proteobacteria bacterium]|nr:glycine--tRNA ligase subunit beta [Pseudomonadota bacterium]
MAELLLELLSEEIPARMQRRAAADLERAVTTALRDAQLDFTSAQAFSTPRRLILFVDGLPTQQPDITVERKGPRADAPDNAIQGFLKSVGLDRDDVEVRDSEKGKVLYAVISQHGRTAADVLKEVLPNALAAVNWPKSMRWGAYEMKWVRPLHTILCVFDGAAVPFTFGHLVAANMTAGHRIHQPHRIIVNNVSDYRLYLDAAKVMFDQQERERVIRVRAAELAAAEGLSVVPDDALFAEITGLVELPVVLMGAIDEAFMAVPPEVLTAAMRGHQKYIALHAADGSLAPRFIFVANLEAADGGKAIIAGNERVLRARLSDAKFFWDQDRSRPLRVNVLDLEGVIFHADIGTLAEKVYRMEIMVPGVIKYVPGANHGDVANSVRLCKADLLSGMVGEFPELQGIIGRYYALHDGENSEVAQAIADHYRPLGPADDCPTAPVSVAVALVDKIYTLVS